jgi:uncharacterized protein (DUF2342 family)
MPHRTDPPGPENRFFCHKHAVKALERFLKGERNVEGHLRHVVYRLAKEVQGDCDTLGRHWRRRRRK